MTTNLSATLIFPQINHRQFVYEVMTNAVGEIGEDNRLNDYMRHKWGSCSHFVCAFEDIFLQKIKGPKF